MGSQGLTVLPLRDDVPPSSSPLFAPREVPVGLLSRKRQYIPAPASDLRNLIDEVVDLARILTGANGSAIAFRKEHGTICLATSGAGAPPIGARVDATSGICRQCLLSGTALWCEDVAIVEPDIARTAGIRAVAVAPIYRGKEISGILAVFSSVPRVFTELHLLWLQQLAGWIGSVQGVRAEKSASARALGSARQHNWNYVLIDNPVPWQGFIESVFLHVFVVGIVAALSAIWPQVLPISPQPLRDAHVTYYPFSQSFPAYESSRPVPNTRQHKVARQKSRGVRPDASVDHDAVEARKNDGPSLPIPDMPLVKTRRFQAPAIDSAVSPAPEIGEANSHRLQLPRNSVIAPPPEISGAPGLRTINAPKAAIIPPSPDVSGAATHSAGMRGQTGVGSGTGEISIVPPAPSLDNRALIANRAAGVVPGARVIAAPPTIQAGLTSAGTRRGVSIGNGVAQIVPPPPSLTGTGNSLGSGRGNSFTPASNGSQIVPPPPSLAGTGNSLGSGRGNSFTPASNGSQIVPPPPSLAGTGNSLGGGRGDSLVVSGGGAQIVPPPPSMQSGRNIGDGRGFSSLDQGTSELVPPPPSISASAGGRSGTRGRGGSLSDAPVESALPPLAKADIPRIEEARPAKPPASATDLDLSHRVFQDMQLRVIGLAWAPPRSSYFSNFEVFIAEKWVNKRESQFIKLVYVFLPYQRRLSQYGVDALRTRRLRVTRDSTCDENLMQMMWPEDENAGSRPSGGALASPSSERNELLPCYVTTADDYRRAVSRGR